MLLYIGDRQKIIHDSQHTSDDDEEDDEDTVPFFWWKYSLQITVC